MNYLIAKKKKTNNDYFMILSSESVIYDIPEDMNNPKEYDNNYKLEDDEWFGIDNFAGSNYSIPLLGQDFNSAEMNQVPNGDYLKIKYLCAYQMVENNSYYCFQRFALSNVVKKKWFKIGEPDLITDEPIVIIKEKPDAIYEKETDTLFFKNLTDIKGIFPNTAELYKEATDEETESFLNQDFILTTNSYTKDSVKTANRKRIAMAIETLNSLQPEEKQQIHSYIRSYCPELNFSEVNNTFEIGSEDNLKNLIFGIEQRFYTTPVGNEKRVANSITKLVITQKYISISCYLLEDI